jgi:hypothetical protein
LIKPKDDSDRYRERLVEAFTDLMREQRKTDLSYTLIFKRIKELSDSPPSFPSVRRWLKEFVKPDDDERRALFAEALGVERDWLFRGVGPKKLVQLPQRMPGKTISATLNEKNKAASDEGGSDKQA